MKQTLHLLVLDVDRRAALAATYGSRWLLPVVTCRERTRALPLVARWLTERGISGDVAGQWLGRVTDTAIDWVLPIALEPGRAATPASLRWHSFDALASSASVLEYQQWAFARTLGDGAQPFVDGPFGSLSWPHEVRSWIGGVTESPIAELTPYRAGAHEVVVGVESSKGRVYFKGLTEARASEPRLTRALAALEPESFARTIATARRHDGSVWWLTAECAGRPGGNLRSVAASLARIQRRVLTSVTSVPCPRLDLEHVARWADDLLGDSSGRDTAGRAIARLCVAAIPSTWIPMDLDPTNVLVDYSDRARFIDIDDSFLGPAPLAMATLAMRCRDRGAYRTYERSWSGALAGLDWTTVETAAAVVYAWLGWNRLERNIARREVFVDAEFAWRRTRARLSSAIEAQTPWPATPAGPAT